MTEQERFARCLAEVLRLEGGYADDPRDPGGETKFGLTRATLGQALGRPASAAEVAALTPEAAAPVYERLYWSAMRCGELPAGLDLLAFDMAVNMGVGTAARLLQAVLGAEVDGIVGPKTIAQAPASCAPEVIRRLSDLRRQRYRSLSGFGAFGRGWLRRSDRVEALALAWAGAAPLAKGVSA